MKYNGLIAFLAGIAVGSVTTWYFVKKRYEQIAQEEIDSVKAVFSRDRASQEAAAECAKDLEDPVQNTRDTAEYKTKLEECKYTNYSNSPIPAEPAKVESKEVADIPYVIPPEEFGEFSDYSRITLTYYSDHILADENDELVEDVDDVVGFESLTHFGDYEDDSVHVRNDRLKVDYEILLDQRKYADIIKTKPYLREV